MIGKILSKCMLNNININSVIHPWYELHIPQIILLEFSLICVSCFTLIAADILTLPIESSSSNGGTSLIKKL